LDSFGGLFVLESKQVVALSADAIQDCEDPNDQESVVVVKMKGRGRTTLLACQREKLLMGQTG
jgi:hypothetical protein